MKKLLLLLTFLTVACHGVFAQYYSNMNRDQSSVKLGFGISSGFAVGPVSSVFPEAGNISVNLEFPLKKSPVSVLFSTGYTFYVSQSGYDVYYDGYGYGGGTYYGGDIASFIPIEAGLKIKVANRVFVEGLAGVSFNVNTYSSDYTYKPTAFIFSPGVGYSLPIGFNNRSSLDFSLFYENRPEPGGGYQQVGVKADWNFNL